MGLEKCPDTNRFHLQCFIYFKEKKSFAQVKTLLNTLGFINAHMEATKGSVEANVDYCTKEGSYLEWGTKPFTQKEKGQKGGEATASKYSEDWTKVQKGEFTQLNPVHLRAYEYARMRMMPPPPDRPKLYNYWIHGPSGAGKSATIRRVFKPHEIYYKTVNKWWDAYCGQPVVLIEDLEPSHHSFLSYHLKLWADHYAFVAESKGSSMKVRPSLIVITSQYTIGECFQLADQATRDAMERRFESHAPSPALDHLLTITKEELVTLDLWEPKFYDGCLSLGTILETSGQSEVEDTGASSGLHTKRKTSDSSLQTSKALKEKASTLDDFSISSAATLPLKDNFDPVEATYGPFMPLSEENLNKVMESLPPLEFYKDDETSSFIEAIARGQEKASQESHDLT